MLAGGGSRPLEGVRRMRWQIAVGGLAALLLVGGAGCGAASSGSYSPRGDYGYGDMFAQSEEMGRREHSDSYGGHAGRGTFASDLR